MSLKTRMESCITFIFKKFLNWCQKIHQILANFYPLGNNCTLVIILSRRKGSVGQMTIVEGGSSGSEACGRLQGPSQGIWPLSLTFEFITWVEMTTDRWPAGLTRAGETAFVVRSEKIQGDRVMDSGVPLFCCPECCWNWPKDSCHQASVTLAHHSFPPRHQTGLNPNPHGPAPFQIEPHRIPALEICLGSIYGEHKSSLKIFSSSM